MKKMKLNIQRFATVLNNKLSNGVSPYAYYTVEASYNNRTATTVNISVTVTSSLRYQSSSLGTGSTMGLNAYFKFNGVQYGPLALKATNESWSGTKKHTKSTTYTISNLDINSTNIDIQFKVDRTGSSAGTSNTSTGAWLAWTTCSSLTIESGAKYIPAMAASLEIHPNNPGWYNMTNTYAWIDWSCTSDSTISSINQLQITYGASGQNGTTIYRDVSGKSGSFQLSGLSGNTAYWVNVYGRSSDGIWSTTAAVVTFTTYSNPIDMTSVTITSLTPTSVTVNVVPSTTNNLDHYSYLLFDENGSIIGNNTTANNYCTFSGLTPEKYYILDVTAHPKNQGSVNAISKGVSFTTPADQATILVKTDNGWQRGKVFIKTENGWIPAKKVFVKTGSEWTKAINA